MAKVEINKVETTGVQIDDYPTGTYFIYTIADDRHPVVKTTTTSSNKARLLDLATGAGWEGKGGTLEVLPSGTKITITVD